VRKVLRGVKSSTEKSWKSREYRKKEQDNQPPNRPTSEVEEKRGLEKACRGDEERN